METRKATRVRVRHHAYMNDNMRGRKETYYSDEYEVGKEHIIPTGGENDMITEIRVVSSWLPHIEIEFEDWGELWINDYVIEIQFENERYREIRSKKRAARAGEDSTGQPQGPNQD